VRSPRLTATILLVLVWLGAALAVFQTFVTAGLIQIGVALVAHVEASVAQTFAIDTGQGTGGGIGLSASGSTTLWLMNGLYLSSGRSLLGANTGWNPVPSDPADAN